VSLHPDRFAAGDLLPVPETTPNAKRLVASGRVVEGMCVKILSPDRDAAYADFRIGEIGIAGESVFERYWNGSPGGTGGRRTADGFFRTGDLGFTADGYLFVTGRSKEMIIIRGKNYFPHDLEHYAGAGEAALEPGGVAAFAVEVNGYPELVIMAELKRGYAGRAAEVGPGLCQSVEAKLVRETGLKPYDVVLVNPLAIPRTSSGKRKRLQCAAGYPAGPYLFAARTAAAPAPATDDTGPAIRQYLGRVFAAKRPALPPHLAPDAELTGIGIDSLRALEIVNTINKDLQINLDVTQVYQANTVAGLVAAIETTLWLHHSATDHPAIGKGIII
jgi:acyl carrier protein